MNQWLSGIVSALHSVVAGLISRLLYTLLMRPNKDEIAVQCSVCCMECLPDFLVIVIQFIVYDFLKNVYL